MSANSEALNALCDKHKVGELFDDVSSRPNPKEISPLPKTANETKTVPVQQPTPLNSTGAPSPSDEKSEEMKSDEKEESEASKNEIHDYVPPQRKLRLKYVTTTAPRNIPPTGMCSLPLSSFFRFYFFLLIFGDLLLILRPS